MQNQYHKKKPFKRPQNGLMKLMIVAIAITMILIHVEATEQDGETEEETFVTVETTPEEVIFVQVGTFAPVVETGAAEIQGIRGREDVLMPNLEGTAGVTAEAVGA